MMLHQATASLHHAMNGKNIAALCEIHRETDPTIEIIYETRVHRDGQEEITAAYAKGKFLGKGGFARCYEMRDLATGRIYAGKIVDKSTLVKPRAAQKLKTEIKIHRSLHHKNIVRFERYFEDSKNVYILLEMCNHKSMMELLKKRKRLAECEVRYYMKQIIQAVQFMHENRVIHRDLKLGNLFIREMRVKIGDFGLATQLEHDGERKKTICGTPNYIAPEILSGRNGHSYEVDIWGLGVIMYTLLVGTPPFETDKLDTTYQRIKSNIWSFPSGVEVSDEARSLVTEILHTIPECRPSLQSILDHKFFEDKYTPNQLPDTALLSIPNFPITPAKSPMRSVIPVSPSIKSSPIRIGPSPSRVTQTRKALFAAESTNNENHSNNAQPSIFGERNIHGKRSTFKEPNQKPADNSLQSPKGKIRVVRDGEVIRMKDLRSQMNQLSTEVKNEKTVTSSLISTGVIASTRKELPRTNSMETIHLSENAPNVCENPQERQDRRERITLIRKQAASMNQQLSERRNDEEKQCNSVPMDVKSSGAVSSKEAFMMSEAEKDQRALEIMHKGIADLLCNLDRDVMSTKPVVSLGTPGCWVQKWVDFSHKYGLGYQLIDGTFGGIFNDSSRILFTADGKNIEYYETFKNSEGSSHTEFKSFPSSAADHQSDPQLHKKVVLLKYFRDYLNEHSQEIILETTLRHEKQAHITKWFRTKSAIIFRLNNKAIQANFFDHTKLMLSSEGQVVTFVNRKRDRSTCYLDQVQFDSQPEITSRLKYIRDILLYLISKSRGASKDQDNIVDQ